MFLCVCKAVRVSEAIDAARCGIDSPELIRQHFGFDDEECCGRCAREIESIAVYVQLELRKGDRVIDLVPARVAA